MDKENQNKIFIKFQIFLSSKTKRISIQKQNVRQITAVNKITIFWNKFNIR